jgi:hypothetical protein
MSTPAGWYPDNTHEGQLRYWDGHSWTSDHKPASGLATATAPQPAPVPAAPARSGTGPSAKPVWYRRTWVVAVAAVILGVAIGSAAAGSNDVKADPAYKKMADELAGAQRDVTSAKDAQAKAEAAVGDLPSREATLKKSQAQLKADQGKLDQRATAVASSEQAVHRRELAVGLVERRIAANTISDGLYEVGTDIKAGTYKTTGASGCYYAVLGSSNTGNILNNSFNNGPSIVTVAPGQFLELNCSGAKWVLQQ